MEFQTLFFQIVLGLAITFMIYTVLRIFFATRLRILYRVNSLVEQKEHNLEEDPYSLPFKERIIIPVFKKMENSIVRWTPASLKMKELHLLRMAGYPHNLTLQEWTTVRIIIWFLVGGLFTLLGMNQEVITNSLLLIITGWILGYMAPVFYLKKKKEERSREMEKGLPYVLDILTVSVNAGLGFDSSLIKVVEKTKGTLSDEFNKTLQEMKMGKSRREALKDLGERSGVDDMVQFTSSIIQAEQLGVRIGNVLKVQSEDMRNKRRQRAEEKAMKAPIKILFPLVLFIFPAIFIVILGPAVINIINNFPN